MTDWAPGLAGIMDNGFGSSRGSNTVDGIVLHHTANGGGTSALNYVANANSRNSHPNYLVQSDGKGWGIVNPNKRPWSTAGQPDEQAIAFEVDNSAGAPDWTISDAALEEVAQITLHHNRESPRYGHGIARNIKGVIQHEFFVAWHSQYAATACPGPSMVAHIDSIIARVLELDKPVVVPPPVVTPPVVDPPVVTPPVVDPPVVTPPVVDPPVVIPPIVPVDYSYLPDSVTNPDGSVNVPLPGGTNLTISDIPTVTLPLTTARKAQIAGIMTTVLTGLEVAAQIIPDGAVRLWVMIAAGVITVGGTYLGVYVAPNLPKITKSK